MLPYHSVVFVLDSFVKSAGSALISSGRTSVVYLADESDHFVVKGITPSAFSSSKFWKELLMPIPLSI